MTGRCIIVHGLLAGALALALADCATAPAPQPPPVVPRLIQAHWIFGAGGACTATVATALLAMDIAASPAGFTVSVRLTGHRGLPRTGTLIDFAGVSGGWQVMAHGLSRHKATATEPMNEEAARRVRILLGGGILHFGGPGEGLAALRVPAGDAAARSWYECVRAAK